MKKMTEENQQIAENFKRTQVWIRDDLKSSSFSKAPFEGCLLDYFNSKERNCYVNLLYNDNTVYLEPGYEESENKQLLEHPSFCAVHCLREEQRKSLPEKSLRRGVDVGVSVILESSDEKILITRRAAHMRTFPGVWVPPGGHIEDNESLEEAGLREVHEEVGLLVKEYTRYSGILGLWESCFPPVLYCGLPVRHHLVIYLYQKLNISSDELLKQMKLDASETDACAWLDHKLVDIVLDRTKENKYIDLPIMVVNDDNEQEIKFSSSKFLRKKMPFPDHEIERLTTGTRYALKLWKEKKLNGMDNQFIN